ncbi:MAG: energy transducer TonB [Candidatus Sulfotelmatobacter sp.]
MTAATPGPGPNLFSMFSAESDGSHRARRETFVFSLLGQAAILGLVIYFTSFVIGHTPEIADKLPSLRELPLIFSGNSGGGGGNRDPLPASRGNIPKASLDPQLAPPTAVLPKEPPKLAVDESVNVVPDVKLPQGGQIGDPFSKFSIPSDGPGGPTGIGTGCCGGIGPSAGTGVGPGPPGIYSPGRGGVTVPQVIFNPEPSFSDEARKAKAQGIVLLVLVVGKDGRPHDIRVGQSLGMGLDEKAIEAVNRWRFRPATLDGQPVATQIAVQVDFHLY